MSEVGLAGFEILDGGEGFGDGHVGVVIFVAKGVDDKDVKVLKEGERLGWDRFNVGEVGQGKVIGEIEAKAVGANPAVFNLDRGDFEAVEFEGFFERAWVGVDVATLFAFVEKGPREHAVEAAKGFGRSVEREGIVAMPAEGADFIEARDVIDVLVGVEDGVDGSDVLPERLFVKVGAGVDEETPPRALNQGGAAETAVMGVIRGASRAWTADDRHADRGGGAQKKEAALIRTRAHGCNWAKALHNRSLIAKRNAHSSQDS